ncbi:MULTISPECIES: hypothetical protein [Bacillus amyloliquefaciens group]|uniref:hypothetical protein n=1 Tax=Bacillus TaxID=1386 RepID=UPI0011CCBB53|nr:MULTISPECIES: hypothetical protein [Bacillus amyloliquefaciens group]MBW8279951.1 hypothetical protein [Bacillus amyloliquefaciens]TXK25913.1 hypothetical protein FVD42_04845 [Bacillus amyloliquefaciens]TXK32489.1 hypothetical protein FVD41_05030 [Bacillus amyloliquefaciens]UZD72323.1 hypothetical protein OM992_10815 [Bacillus siamensis]WBY35373.1 hypothetical protein PF976_09180 [Bacillus amyloliquefaciens]
MMKFFEVSDPYYALIKANTKEKAMKLYTEEVADDDEENLSKEMYEVSLDHAVKAYIHRTGFEQGFFFKDEITNNLKGREEGIVVMDGHLL